MIKKIKRFKFDYILYLILGLGIIAFGICLFPFVTSVGANILEVLTAIFLIIYLIGYLLPKILVKHNRYVTSFYIFEFVVVGLMALGNILSQAKILNISGVVETLGVTLFVRGLSELVVSYSAPQDHRKKFVIFLIDVVVLSFGVFLVAKPILNDEQVLIILAVLFILLGLFSIFLSVSFWDKKPRVKKDKNAKKETKEVKEIKKEETVKNPMTDIEKDDE